MFANRAKDKKCFKNFRVRDASGEVTTSVIEEKAVFRNHLSDQLAGREVKFEELIDKDRLYNASIHVEQGLHESVEDFVQSLFELSAQYEHVAPFKACSDNRISGGSFKKVSSSYGCFILLHCS